ncbi:MAG: hypothetical protein RR863_02850 [Erysipelotrichaceae bacterium]
MSSEIYGSGTCVADMKESTKLYSKEDSITLRISIDKSAKIKSFKSGIEEKGYYIILNRGVLYVQK